MNAGLTRDECLRELRKQAGKAEFSALVIGFERETRFVWSSAVDAPGRLEKLLNAGGKAIGVFGANVVANAVVYYLEPFPPYDTQDWVRPYLAGVGDTVMEIFKERWQNARN